MLDFRIETFLCVCRRMNFTEAAEELHLTQPAVTQHIHWLEQRYGTPLFFREGRRVRLTPAGEMLLEAMQVLRNDEAALARRLQSCAGQRQTLTFGVTLTVGEYAVVPALAGYLRRRPELDVRVRYANTAALLEALRAGSLEFAIVEGYVPPAPFETMRFCTQPYIAVCAAGHVFARAPQTLSDLLGERLLLREHGSGTREILEKSLAVQGLTSADFAHTAEVENMHAIVALLRADCGITFLYRAAVEAELAVGSVRAIPLSDLAVRHDFSLVWNRGSVFAPEYRAFCRALQAELPGITNDCRPGGAGAGEIADTH